MFMHSYSLFYLSLKIAEFSICIAKTQNTAADYGRVLGVGDPLYHVGILWCKAGVICFCWFVSAFEINWLRAYERYYAMADK